MTAAGGLSDALGRLASEEDRQPAPDLGKPRSSKSRPRPSSANAQPRQPKPAAPRREPEIVIRPAESLRADETTVLSVDEIMAEDEQPKAKPATPRPATKPAAVPAAPAARPRSASAPAAQAVPAASARRSGSSSASRSRTGSSSRRPKKDKHHEIKRTAIPILITVGVLLLVPGFWAVAVMMGFEVLRHDDPKANQVAIAMLTTFPMSLCMIAGAIFFWMQTAKTQAELNDAKGIGRKR